MERWLGNGRNHQMVSTFADHREFVRRTGTLFALADPLEVRLAKTEKARRMREVFGLSHEE